MTVAEAERGATEPADLAVVHFEAESVRRVLAARQSNADATTAQIEVPNTLPPPS